MVLVVVEPMNSLAPLILLPALPQEFSSFTQYWLHSQIGLFTWFHQLLNEASQMAVMLGSCLQASQSIIDRVRAGFLPWDEAQVGPVIDWPFP